MISQISNEQAYHLDISLPKVAVYSEETPVHTSEATFKLLTHPRLLDVVELLIGPEIYSNPIQHARIKPPESVRKSDAPGNGYLATTPWHQDQGVITADADETDILSVWIAVTDATEENGCLCMIPGSHREGLAPHCFEIPEKFRENFVTPVPMKAGSALFFHRLTKHSSLPNHSDDIRFSFDLRYSPVGMPSGRDEFPGFVARSRQHPESISPTTDSGPRCGTLPAGVHLPQGVIGFSLRDVPIGGSVAVQLIVHAGDPPIGYWKFGPTADNPVAHWYAFAFDGATGGLVLDSRTVQLQLVDGGRGDSDLTANGVIVDPGGPGGRVMFSLWLPVVER